MAKRYDVMHAKEVEGRDKPLWNRCGVAFEGEKGISIKLEYIPIGIDLKDGLWLRLFEPRNNNQKKDDSF